MRLANDLVFAAVACRWHVSKRSSGTHSTRLTRVFATSAREKILYYLPTTRIWPRISPPGEMSVCTFA